MLRLSRVFIVLCCSVLCPLGSASAESIGKPGGDWPKTWPQELEPLRKQAWTWEHGIILSVTYEIAFKNREQFEAAWPDLLKIKSQGAPIILKSGPHIMVWSKKDGKTARNQPAGVSVQMPLKGEVSGPLSQTRIVLVVDGQIVDLNRIQLPADTPIDDQRFQGK